jgi:hypothetical protein
MLNFVENLLENERGPMNDQDLTKTDYDPDRGSLSFSNKFSTKFSIVSNKLKTVICVSCQIHKIFELTENKFNRKFSP